MSNALCLLLESDHVSVLPREHGARGGVDAVREFAWSPASPALLVDALRNEFAKPSSLLLIVGLSFLEIAHPELPPVPNEMRVRMLQRDSDRFFALREPAAVATDGHVAFAMSAAQLTSWVDAFSLWSVVGGVLSIGQAAVLSACNGEFSVSAGAGESGRLTIVDGHVQEARRRRISSTSRASGATSVSPVDPAAPPTRTLSVADVAPGAWRAAAGPLDLQLLDAALRRRLMHQRARRRWLSVALAAAALAMLAWSADGWRERQLVALQQERQTLEQTTTAARAAQLRVVRADDERVMLQTANARAAAPDAPPVVLARLGRLLPSDAFIQRLEWNGSEWRIDGSASDAAALVPLLDADAQFESVRSAAPSTRYIEAGRPRSSFSIVFTTVAPRGGS